MNYAKIFRDFFLNKIFLNISILFLILLLPLYYETLFQIPHICIIDYFFHIPCPGCGVLRSFIALSSFDIGQAIALNPLSMVIIIYFISEIILEILFKNNFINLIMRQKGIRNLNLIFSYLCLINWILMIK